MCNKNPDMRLPEKEQDVIEQVKEERDCELTEQKKSLAVAQARLIGDLPDE